MQRDARWLESGRGARNVKLRRTVARACVDENDPVLKRKDERSKSGRGEFLECCTSVPAPEEGRGRRAGGRACGLLGTAPRPLQAGGQGCVLRSAGGVICGPLSGARLGCRAVLVSFCAVACLHLWATEGASDKIPDSEAHEAERFNL